MFLSRKGKQGKYRSKNKDAKTCLIPRIIFSVKTKCRCYPGRETQEIKKNRKIKKHVLFSFYNHVSFFFMCFISFMCFHFFSFLDIFCHCCSFPVFRHWKKPLPIQTTGMLTHYFVLLIKNIFGKYSICKQTRWFKLQRPSFQLWVSPDFLQLHLHSLKIQGSMGQPMGKHQSIG